MERHHSRLRRIAAILVAALVSLLAPPGAKAQGREDKGAEAGQAAPPGEEVHNAVLDPERALSSAEACDMVRRVMALMDAGRPEAARWSAAAFLGRRLQHVATIPVLEDVSLRRGESDQLRIEAIRALAVVASPRAVNALIRILAATEADEWGSIGIAAEQKLARLVFGRKRSGEPIKATDYQKAWEERAATTDLPARVGALRIVIE